MKKSHVVLIFVVVFLFVLVIVFLNSRNKKNAMSTNHVIQEACAVGEYGIAYDESGEDFNLDIMLNAMNYFADANKEVALSFDEVVTQMEDTCPSFVKKFIHVYQEE